ncbi:MAG: glycosyltransferase [Actinobacteria bacterium]|nr:glycosyltransferase [Actinomycetota bacterium]
MSAAPRSRGIPFAGLARAAVATTLGLLVVGVELSVRGETDIRRQVAAQLTAFVLFLPGAWLCWRGLGIGRAGVGLVLVVGVLLHAVAFDPSSPPPLTTDTYRYAWDARVQAAGINPYRYAPEAPALEPLRDVAIWDGVNRKSWRTLYPPGAEAGFLAARGLFGTGVRATTWLFLVAEALAAVLLVLTLLRLSLPVERVALLAWHPLAVSEIAANGHSDALALLACSALLAAFAYGRRGLAGVAVGVGALVKLGPVLLLPALLRRGGRRFAWLALATIAAGYLAYASAGTKVVGSIFQYLDEEDLGSLAWWSLQPHLGGEPARILLLVVLLAVVAVVALRAHDSVDQVARSGLLILGTALLTAAFLQPWYALWLLPFLVVTAAPAWLWLTGTLPLLYVFALEGDALPWWVRTAIYGPFLALVLLRVARPSRPALRSFASMPPTASVGVAIPVIDEAESLPGVLQCLPELVDEVVVVDGGSRDGTPDLARAEGARVVVEPRHGYGRACAAGSDALGTDVVVWLDGDGSDDPDAIGALVEPVLSGRAALSLGVRTRLERGAQHWHQRLGNRLVAWLVRLTTGVTVRDIPPMRAIRRDALEQLALREMTYGWPTEMVIVTARAGFPIAEVEVPSRARRGGRSKVSGRLGPSVRAGARMLSVVARHA